MLTLFVLYLHSGIHFSFLLLPMDASITFFHGWGRRRGSKGIILFSRRVQGLLIFYRILISNLKKNEMSMPPTPPPPPPPTPLPRSTHTGRLNISLREVLNNNVPGEVLLTKQSTVKSLIKIHDWYWHDFNNTCFEQNLVIIYMQGKLPWWFRIQYMWSR